MVWRSANLWIRRNAVNVAFLSFCTFTKSYTNTHTRKAHTHTKSYTYTQNTHTLKATQIHMHAKHTYTRTVTQKHTRKTHAHTKSNTNTHTHAKNYKHMHTQTKFIYENEMHKHILRSVRRTHTGASRQTASLLFRKLLSFTLDAKPARNLFANLPVVACRSRTVAPVTINTTKLRC